MDPKNRHHLKSVRREGYDYRNGEMYYVTICTDQRERVFGEIRHGMMGWNEWGCIVADEIQKTPFIRPYVTIDTFIIMPNHVHLILYMDDPAYRNGVPDRNVVGASSQDAPTPVGTPRLLSGSLGSIIGQIKTVCTKRINALRDAPGQPVWQRNFYEHIIRKPEELDRIRTYILHNPRNWLKDEEYID